MLIVDSEESTPLDSQTHRQKALVEWIMSRVDAWRDYRDSNYKAKWDEYYRLWRGIWTEEDRTRDSERSKIISPAIQQAVEATVAELEEAAFGKPMWFDASDDVRAEQKINYGPVRTLLMEDLDKAKVKRHISEVFLNGALYGTGIAKLIVEETVDYSIAQELDENVMLLRPSVGENKRFTVRVEAVSPRDFLIDPAARNIEEALGVAHEIFRPAHTIKQKQKDGIYQEGDFGTSPEDEDVAALGETKSRAEDKVKIIEYHGLVPKKLLPGEEADTKADEPFVFDPDMDFELVEALVTIANGSFMLKESPTPFLMKDRSWLAYQHDTVPNRFWGRGIVEKGYNPQKALDAELRARIDGLAQTVHPMIAGDATRLPRGVDLTVRPGKQVLTHGNPAEALMPFRFGDIDQNTFRNAADLERMIQMATGAMDSATPTSINPRNQTASGMSMMISGAIKRNKRTMANIAENLLNPLVKKALWRYIQFDPERYPTNDFDFKVVSTMGIMAREFEQSQLTQLLQTVPPQSPPFWTILKGIINNSSTEYKEEVAAAVEQMVQQAQQPDPMAMAQMKAQQEAEQGKLMIDKARVKVEARRVMVEEERLKIAKRKQLHDEHVAQIDGMKTEADAILSLAKAEAEEVGQQLEQYKQGMEELKVYYDQLLRAPATDDEVRRVENAVNGPEATSVL